MSVSELRERAMALAEVSLYELEHEDEQQPYPYARATGRIPQLARHLSASIERERIYAAALYDVVHSRTSIDKRLGAAREALRAAASVLSAGTEP